MLSQKTQSWLAILALACASAGVVAAAVTIDDTVTVRASNSSEQPADGSPLVDQFFEEAWHKAGIVPAPLANELTVLRRASLALHGTVPSLEEIRTYEADERPDRLRLRVRAMLADSRFADYFAERLARPWVGVSRDPFLIYRRDRFTRWLAGELRENRPYDEVARRVLSTDGLWTSEPAANFVTSAVANDDLDENVLTARTVRGFLGQRIDCASATTIRLQVGSNRSSRASRRSSDSQRSAFRASSISRACSRRRWSIESSCPEPKTTLKTTARTRRSSLRAFRFWLNACRRMVPAVIASPLGSLIRRTNASAALPRIGCGDCCSDVRMSNQSTICPIREMPRRSSWTGWATGSAIRGTTCVGSSKRSFSRDHFERRPPSPI